MNARKIFRVILMLCIMDDSPFIFGFEFESVFPINEEGRILQRNADTKTRLAEFQDEIDIHGRARRQATCFPPISCGNSPYRSIDGTCNNVNNPYWGASFIPFIRYLPSQYEDGSSTPRGTGRSPALPRPRTVSAGMVETAITSKNDGFTLMVMQWGQFTDHDFVFTPENTDNACCSNFQTATPTSTSCLPIDVTGDSFYGPKGFSCLPFVRSTASSCVSGPREQINALTAYLDASQVYGSTASELTALRETNSYKMKFGPDKENSNCASTDSSYPCRIHLPVRKSNTTGNDEFFAGDRRAEEQPGLTSLHALFLRMHNDLAQVIRDRNPGFSITQVFEETRKIVYGVIQQITFHEFLPIVLGTQVMIDYGLTLRIIGASDPFFRNYSSTVDASASNVFATAAFRFGHSLIKNLFTLFGNVQVELSRSFNNHGSTLNANTLPSHFLRGIAIDPSEEMDHIIVTAVHNFLFARSPFTEGQDLYARNIMRGRDHGLPPYTSWINTCIAGAVTTFNDLNKYMPSAVVNKLNTIYGGRVNDIDLFPAAIAENNHPGALVGPTLACILAEFFARTKHGDFFWFENPGVFTINQLRSIRKTRLSTLMCLYTDATQLADNVFLQVNASSNPLRNCTDILKVGVLNDITLYW